MTLKNRAATLNTFMPQNRKKHFIHKKTRKCSKRKKKTVFFKYKLIFYYGSILLYEIQKKTLH